MKKLSVLLTRFIIHNSGVSKEQQAIYEYGLQTGLETLLTLSVCALIAAYSHMLPQGVLFFLIFTPLRAFAGGFHFDKYIFCFSFSCVVFTATLYISSRLTLSGGMFLLIPLCLALVYLLYPVEHINRPTDEEEHLYFKKKLVRYLTVDFILFAVLLLLSQQKILNTFLVTLLLIVFTMILGKISYKRQVKRSL